MKLLVVLALAGCAAKTDNLPIGGGGGGGGAGGGGGGGAIPDAPNDGGGIAGRVCLVSDPRNLVGCATTGADGLTVTLGTSMATTAADGTFSIAAPLGSSLTWHVSGTNLATSVMPYTAIAQIPALTLTTYQDLLSNTGAVLSVGQGSVLARVVHAGAPLTAADATSNPAAAYPTAYDGASPSSWTSIGTGAFGTAFLAGINAGATTVSVTPSGGTAIDDTASVESGAITFLTFDVP